MSTFKPSTILSWFETIVSGITTGTTSFTASPYRFLLEMEPNCGITGTFYTDMPTLIISKARPTYGVGETIWEAVVGVEVGYFRGGGTDSDRLAVLKNAADDMQLLGDVVPNTDNYDQANTGIRAIIFKTGTRVYQDKQKDIYRAEFTAEWQSDLRV